MTPTDEIQLFQWAAKGDQTAAAFLQAITDAAHVWDDIVDGDVPVSPESIDAAFEALVLIVPSNPFYRMHRASLDPLIQQAALNWRVATAIEREAGAPKHVSYILRSSYIDLIGQVALLAGGPLWAVEVITRVRLLNQTETMDDYLTNLDRERAARGEG